MATNIDLFNPIQYATGPSVLEDVGSLSYNGCLFSPLFETKVSGNLVQDDAKRTIKITEYTLSADGYVTLPDGATDINANMNTLRSRLEQQGGALIYRG